MRNYKLLLPLAVVMPLSVAWAAEEPCNMSPIPGTASWLFCERLDARLEECPVLEREFSVETGVTSMSTCTLVVHGPINAATGAYEFYREFPVTKGLPNGPAGPSASGCDDDVDYYSRKPGAWRKLRCQTSNGAAVMNTRLAYARNFARCP